jgi:thioesterase domain-containing protein
MSDLSADKAALLDRLINEQSAVTPAPRLPSASRMRDGAAPLFLVHGSGGRALFVHALARHVTGPHAIYGIEAGTQPGADAEAICAAYIDALRAVQPHGPYRLGGYSAGCLIAFTMAARLMAMGEAVTMLVFIDPAAPPAAQAAAAPDAQQHLARRFEIATLAGVTPLNREFPYIERVNELLATVARDIPLRALELVIHVVHGTRGAYVPDARALERWQALARAGLTRTLIEADHFEIVREPHAAQTAQAIEVWLDGAHGR